MRPGLTTAQVAGLPSVLCATETFSAVTTRHGRTASQWEASGHRPDRRYASIGRRGPATA
jgi:hypothetical protein